MQETLRLIEFAEKHLSRLDRHLVGLRHDGDVDAVHDFRVASRRLQEPLAVIAKCMAREEPRRIQRRLKTIRKTLNTVRDTDVLRASLSDEAGAALDEPTRARLDGLLTKRRATLLSRACDDLEQGKPEKVRKKLRALIDELRRAGDTIDPKIHDHAWATWRKRVQALRAEQPQDDPGCDLHACRILLKQARYSTELLRSMQNRERGTLVESMIQVQDHLGAWNDHLFAAAELARIASEREIAANHADFSAALYTHAAARSRHAHRLRSDAVMAWSKLTSTIDAECAPQ